MSGLGHGHGHEYLSPKDIQRMQRRLVQSRHRLLTHPAVTESPSLISNPASLVQMTSKPTENAMLKVLFNDLVRRELQVDPSAPNSRALCRDHLRQNRLVATRPSLSAPSLVTTLSSGFDPPKLSEKRIIGRVAPNPLAPHVSSISAEAAHKLLQRRRAERARSASVVLAKPSPAATAGASDSCSPSVSAEAADNAFGRRTRSSTRRAPVDEALRAVGRPACCFCPADEAESSGGNKATELLGPFANPKSPTGAGLYVHYECACWAPQVFTDAATNQLRRVYEEYCRGRQLRCAHCNERGATVGCYVQRCKKVFHFRCLEAGGAYRVERFFVAFCECHSHLAKMSSYKTLMEAATIADVAAVHRKDDATFGLDAPHSRFTKLRRSETEVIFSSRWGVTSVSSAFDSASVIFSHRRRVILRKHDRFSISDGLQTVRFSAIDVASGRLAYMTFVGQSDLPSEMSAIQARAALASRDNTGIFLLRNLRLAPQWTKQQLRLVKSSSHWNENKNSEDQGGDKSNDSLQPRKDLDPSFFRGRYNGDGEPLLIVGSPSGANKSQEKKKRIGRPSKRQRLLTSGSSIEDNPSDSSKDADASKPLPRPSSARLQTLRRFKRGASEEKGTADKCDQDVELESSPTGSGDTVPKDPSNKSVELSVQNLNPVQSEMAVIGLRGKVKSAWETFLADELPKERILRPDDAMEDTMRNMARLWSLMTTKQRAAYEERARKAASMEVVEKDPVEAGDSAGLEALLEQSRRRGRQMSGQTSSREAGLFASGGAVEKTVPHSGKRQASVSLPRMHKRPLRQNKRVTDRDESFDLDDMFPDINLDGSSDVDLPSTERAPIRDPPPRRHRKHR